MRMWLTTHYHMRHNTLEGTFIFICVLQHSSIESSPEIENDCEVFSIVKKLFANFLLP